MYRIRDWNEHFAKKCTKSTVAVPTKHNGKAYRRLMRKPNGVTLFGAWVLIVEVASTCPTRGTLFDKEPLTADDLEARTDCPAEIFEEAIEVLCSDEIGWIEEVDCVEVPTLFKADNYIQGSCPIPAVLDTPIFREAWGEWLQHKREKKKTYKEIGEKNQLARLAAWGVNRAVAAIRYSSSQDWTGIFEDRTNGKPAAVVNPQEREARERARREQQAAFAREKEQAAAERLVPFDVTARLKEIAKSKSV